MSNEAEKLDVPKEDADALGELLDSSAKAFAPRKVVTDDELDELMERADQAAAQKAATQFQSFLKEMVDVHEEALRQSKEGEQNPDQPPEDEDASHMVEAMKQLLSCAGKIADANSEQEFLAGMDMLRDPDSSFEPLMSVIMESLVTKDIIYPPLKELSEKYPAYLAENKEKVDAETFEKYESQYKCIVKICEEFEKQPDTPATEAPTPEEPSSESAEPQIRGDVEKIGRMLMELQTYGYPPMELVGDLPEGWGMGDGGMPQVDNLQQAASQCSIM